MTQIFVKDPNSILDYSHNWNDGYLESGETVLTSSWSIEPLGLTQDSNSNNTTTTTVFVSGGTHGILYCVVNKVTTSKSRTEERALHIRVWEPV